MTQLSLVGLEEVEFKLLTNRFRAPGGEGYLYDTSHGRLGEEEVAAKLNITVDGLRSRLHRAEYDVTDNRVNKVRAIKKAPTVLVEAPTIEELFGKLREVVGGEVDKPCKCEDDFSLLDQFATAALNALLVDRIRVDSSYMEEIARESYQLASAMMEERKKLSRGVENG